MLECDTAVLIFVQVSAFPWSLFCIFLLFGVVVLFVVVCKCLVSTTSSELWIGVIVSARVQELFACMGVEGELMEKLLL